MCVDVSCRSAEGEPGPHVATGANPRQADRRISERIVANEMCYFGAKTAEVLVEYAPKQTAHTLRTFEGAERLWATVVLPAIWTMQPLWPSQGPPAVAPWFSNWRIPPPG